MIIQHTKAIRRQWEQIWDTLAGEGGLWGPSLKLTISGEMSGQA